MEVPSTPSATTSFVFLVVSLVSLSVSVAWFYKVLKTITLEGQATAAMAVAQLDDTQLELEVEDEGPRPSTNGDYVQASHKSQECPDSPKVEKPDDMSAFARRELSAQQKVTIYLQIFVLVLLNFLLLVFLPASVALCFIAVLTVFFTSLWQAYLSDEIWRRRRYDRVVLLLAIFFSMAASMTASVYTSKQLQEGNVYMGPARIVGYTSKIYDNSDGESLRSDLQVAWGGDGVCANECVTTVRGALCQTKYDPSAEDYDVNNYEYVPEDDYFDYGSRRQRRLSSSKKSSSTTKSTAKKTTTSASKNSTKTAAQVEKEEEDYKEKVDEEAEEEEEEFEDEVIDEANEEVDEYEEEVVEEAEDAVEIYEEEIEVAYEDAITGNNTEVKKKNMELEEEVEELEDENEELEEETEEEEEENEELEDEIEEIEYGDYSDDQFEDDYWDYDWNSVWGEYACEDLFDEDLEGNEYDKSIPPGKDDWPVVNVYGTCNSCQTYLQDYYSSEHFAQIIHYRLQAWVYACLSGWLLFVSYICRFRKPASQENKVVLLTSEGGVPA